MLCFLFPILGLGQKIQSQFSVEFARASKLTMALDQNFAYFLFHHPGAYEFFILDELLQPVQRNFISKPDSLHNIQAVALLPGIDDLLLLYQEPSPGKGLRSLRIEKSSGNLQIGKIHLRYDPQWRLLRTFIFDENYYLLSIHEDDQLIKLVEISSREVIRTVHFPPPTKDFAKRLKKRALPIISLDFPQTVHAVSKEKLYIGDSVISLVIDQELENQTIWTNVDLNLMTARTDSIAYQIPLLAKGRRKMANSFMYKDLLIQAVADPGGEKLSLAISDFSNHDLLKQWTFISGEALQLNFGKPWERNLKPKTGKESWRESIDLLKKMRGKLALYMSEGEAQFPILTLGLLQSKRVRFDELIILGASIGYNTAFLSGDLPLRNPNGISYNPFIGLISLGYGLYGLQSQEKRTFNFVQAAFDGESLSLSSWAPVGNTMSRMRLHMAEEKKYKRAKAKKIFTWKEKRYVGYFLNGAYYLVAL